LSHPPPPRSASAICRTTFGGLLLSACLAVVQAAPAADDSGLEAKVKAAYLFHLTKFVDWPALPPDAVRICVINADAVGGMLGELTNRQVQERPLKVEIDVADPTRCQILFIGRGERRSSEILGRVRGASVLTVSDREDFARQGGIVGFYSDAGKLKLEINPEAARAANLKVSAKLLELSRKVATP
jgi:hypothetical protein